MITYVYGDIFQSPAKVLVNPVNTVGVMGKGLAEDFKRFYPDMFMAYRQACEKDEFEIGHLMLYKTPHKWVLNFPTKKHWRAASQIEYIEAGLKKFVGTYAEKGIMTVSFPMLGADELNWEDDVRPLMESFLNPLPISVYVHLYNPEQDSDPFSDERRNVRGIRSWLEGHPVAMPFDKFWRDISRVIQESREFKRADDNKLEFRVLFDTRKRNRRRNLILKTDDPQPIFLSETSLVDMWHYVVRAGYALPQNLPGELVKQADYVISLLAHLEHIRPVYLMPTGTDKVMGMHYIAPVERKPETLNVTLQETT